MATIHNAAAWAQRENERAEKAADRRAFRWVIITLAVLAAAAAYLLLG